MGLTDRPARPARPAQPAQPAPPAPPEQASRRSETCDVCHGVGKIADVAMLHNLSPTTGNVLTAGTLTTAITSVTFGTPVGDNVPVSMTFTFQAISDTGVDVTNTAPLNLLDNSSATQLRFARFSLAKLVPGTAFPASGTQSTNEWFDYVNGSRVNGRLVRDNPGVSPASYTYTFPDNAVTVSGAGSGTPAVPFNDNATTRAAIQISGLPLASFTANTSLTAPVANPTFDLVPNGYRDRHHQEQRHHRGMQRVPRSAFLPRRWPDRDRFLRGLPQPHLAVHNQRHHRPQGRLV